MRAIRTPHTTATFKLVGGGPENDLPVEQGFNGGEEDEPVLRSTWELTDEERRIIAEGGMVELVVFGVGTSPVAMHVVDKSWNVLGTEAVTCSRCGRDLHGYKGPLCRYCDPNAYSE